jgi:hypothetical protein
MGDDMSQSGEDMVLSLFSATDHGWKGCGDPFQIAAFNPEA